MQKIFRIAATTACVETPVNCPHCGQKWRLRRRLRRQPFILLSFSSSKKARKAQETQSYQHFQHIGRTAFNTSGTNAARSLSRAKVGTHSAFGEGSHTRAHTPKQGPSLLRSQCGFVLPAKSLLFHRAFIYIHFPVLCGPSLSAEEKKSAKMPPQLCPQPFLIAFFNFAHKWPTFAFTDESE